MTIAQRVRSEAKRAWRRLRGGELTPWRAALSVAVGLAIGVTPLYGLHLWIVLAICVPLRLDAALAYLAANVSLPFVAPFLLFAEVEIGSWARTGHALAIDVGAVKAGAWKDLVAEVAVGTAVFAPACAIVGGGIAYALAARAQPPSDPAIERVAQRYARGRRATYHYVRSKLASDPVAARLLALDGASPAGPGRGPHQEPLGEVADVGCGRGQVAALLLEAKRATRVRGVDWDAPKIEDARAACDGLDATFDAGDARTCDVAACDTALLVDVLHYMTDDEQDAVIDRCARAARSRVVVRELDPDRGWRSAVTRLQERITTSLGYNRGARVNVRPIAALTARLEARGFTVTIEPCWGATPFSNVLVIATRGARGSE